MKLDNVLHKFRTYQYHFIWIVAKEPNVFAALDKADDLKLYNHIKDSNGVSTPTKKYDKQSHDGNDYVIFYNSMTDSEFTIDDFEYLSQMTGASDNSTSMGLDMKMIISEPYSVDFFTALSYACNQAGAGSLTSTIGNFALKVFFVGNPDEKAEPQVITSLNSIPFFIEEADLSLSTNGAIYSLKCKPTASIGYSPNINKATGVSTSVGEKLSTALKDLESAYNKDPNTTQAIRGKPFQYHFIIDPAYEDAKYTTDLFSNDSKNVIQPPNKENNEDQPELKNNIFTSKPKQTIHDAIYELILTSKAALSEMEKPDKSDPKRPVVWKPRITAAPVTIVDDTPIATINIERSSVPVMDKDTPPEEHSSDIEFDYIYTGKNLDILKFDMHVMLQMAPPLGAVEIVDSEDYYTPSQKQHTNKTDPQKTGDTTTTTATQLKSAHPDAADGPTGPSSADVQAVGGGSLQPGLFSRGRKSLNDAISANSSGLECNLEIMGNPTLMAGWIYPSDTMGKDGKASGEDVKKTKEAHDKKIGMTTSGIKTVKINIRMPKPSYLQGAPSGDDNNFYSSPFWNSNSNFQIHDILSKFTKGKFIQILKLVGQPTTSGVVGGSSTKASQPAKEGDKPTESNDVSGDNLRAFLKMIGMAETGLQGNDGYNILQGGKTFADYSEHPYSHKAVPKSGPAAGRYQIEVATYNGLKSKCGGDFSPGAQDKMAVQLLKNYSAYDLVIAGKPAAAIKAVYRCWTALNPSSKSGKSEKQLLGWYESYGGTYKPQTSEPNASQNASPSKPADSKSVPTGSNGGKLNKVSKGGTNGNWAGSADKLQEVLPNGEYAPSSEKRDRVKTKSGHVSDHYTGNPNAYAVDLGLNNTYGGDKSKANAAALATVNNVRRQEGKAPFASWSQIPRGEYSGTTPDGYRVQVIWDSDVGGNHHDHIHVGVKKK